MNGWRVRLRTELGDIVIALSELAPKSAAAFLAAAEAGELDGISFWRSVRPETDRGSPPISVLQASPSAITADARRVAHESTRVTGLAHTDGAASFARLPTELAYANAFFICVGDQPALDADGGRSPDGFAVFGHVVEGMATVRMIHSAETVEDAPIAYVAGQVLAKPIVIQRATLDVPGTEMEGP